MHRFCAPISFVIPVRLNSPCFSERDSDRICRAFLVVCAYEVGIVITTGKIRFEMRTPGWDDLVSLGVDEIRQFGETSIQVIRRLRAMLEDLLEVLPASRHLSLHRQLDMLSGAASRGLHESDDRSRATVADSQGLGSSRKSRQNEPEDG